MTGNTPISDEAAKRIAAKYADSQTAQFAINDFRDWHDSAAPLLVSAEAERAERERERWQKEAEGWLDAWTAAEAVSEGLRAELADKALEAETYHGMSVRLNGQLAALRAAGGQESDEPRFTVGPDGSVYTTQAGLTLAELGDPSKVAQHVAKRVGIQLPAPVGGQAEREVLIVQHANFDTEAYASAFNDGYETAQQQGIGGAETHAWATAKIREALDGDKAEPYFDLAATIADRLLSEIDFSAPEFVGGQAEPSDPPAEIEARAAARMVLNQRNGTWKTTDAQADAVIDAYLGIRDPWADRYPAPTLHEPPEGWMTFGAHAGRGFDNCPQIEFSAELDDVGEPLWERCISAAAPVGGQEKPGDDELGACGKPAPDSEPLALCHRPDGHEGYHKTFRGGWPPQGQAFGWVEPEEVGR